MAGKVSVATTWLQGCSGCHMSLLDMNHDLKDLLDLIDIQYSPFVDTKEIPEVEISLIEGAVANDENKRIVKQMRERSKTLIAFGTCACTGGISGFRNLSTREDVLTCGYIDTPTTVDGKIPDSPILPKLNEAVKALDQVVPVDHYLPGCPPLATPIKEALLSIIKGKPLPPQTHNLCEACTRKKDRMLIAQRDYLIDEVVSVHELAHVDPEKCFLEQGVLCMGPATREGCGVLCPNANMPCRGCQGPPQGSPEQGAKLINCLSSLLPAGGLMFKEDIEGIGYCFSMPLSIFPQKKERQE